MPMVLSVTVPKVAPLPTTGPTFAGFTGQDIGDFFGYRGATVGQALIDVVVNKTVTPAQAALLKKTFSPETFRTVIPQGLQHLNEHPKGSHYHGDFNINPVTLIANVVTGGLYQLSKGAFDVVTGGKIIPNLKTGFASYGPAGSVLQPTIGTNKTLIVESLVAAPI